MPNFGMPSRRIRLGLDPWAKIVDLMQQVFSLIRRGKTSMIRQRRFSPLCDVKDNPGTCGPGHQTPAAGQTPSGQAALGHVPEFFSHMRFVQVLKSQL